MERLCLMQSVLCDDESEFCLTLYRIYSLYFIVFFETLLKIKNFRRRTVTGISTIRERGPEWGQIPEGRVGK